MHFILVTKRKTGHDYEISVEFWNKIKPLLPLPKLKKKPGRPREDDWKILSGIFISFVQVANGNHCQDVMERQVPSMIDFKSGGKMDYMKECGKPVCWIMIMKKV